MKFAAKSSRRCAPPEVAWFFVKLYLVEVARPDGKVRQGGESSGSRERWTRGPDATMSHRPLVSKARY